MVSPFASIDDQIRAHFPPDTHPYRILEGAIRDNLTPDCAVLDIGCGRTAPNLRKLVGQASTLYGVDLVDFRVGERGLNLFQGSASEMPFLEAESVDIAYSRSVMEHVEDPRAALQEVRRVLRPGGCYIFLTPNFYDYSSLIAHAVPNAWHPKIVNWATGREEEDVFPTYYRANTRRQIEQLASETGLRIHTFRYLGQYPAYVLFSRPLFWLASAYERVLRGIPALGVLQGWIFCILVKPGDDPPRPASRAAA